MDRTPARAPGIKTTVPRRSRSNRTAPLSLRGGQEGEDGPDPPVALVLSLVAAEATRPLRNRALGTQVRCND